MNLLADEGVDKQIVVRLREEGYSVSYVAEMAPGISDDIVLELANKEGSLLLTSELIAKLPILSFPRRFWAGIQFVTA